MRKFIIVCVCFCAVSIVAMQNTLAQEQDDLANLSPDGEEMYQKALQALKAAVSDEDYANALAFAKKILVFDPNRADVCYKIAEMAMLIKDITGILAYQNEAMRYFDKAVQIDPSYSDEVDKQYNLMTFEGELMPSVPIPETNQNTATASDKPEKNDLIFLYDGRISLRDLKTIKENQPTLYDEYFILKAKHKRLRDAGWITFGVGFGVGLLGLILSDQEYGFAALGGLGMSAGLYAGIPIIIVGSVRMKRTDRYIADEYNKTILYGYRTAATFSLGSTRNGLGFLVKF